MFGHMRSLRNFQLLGKKLGKVWIFFTQKYFAPYTQFHDSVTTFVMDRSYTKKPVQVREWTNIFMKNDAKCK